MKCDIQQPQQIDAHPQPNPTYCDQGAVTRTLQVLSMN